MKRIWSILLTLVLLLSLSVPAAAAENTASTMRLMETEGTVAAENASGKALTLWDGMRLYSGYEVSTEDASYAYISLDNSKTAKLDASSAAAVAQSGKHLELNLTAGSLFFNVPVALKSDESMNIRTSTMVTGIRGTAGWVRTQDRYTTRIGLLEGMATIHSRDPLTGENRSVTITGGQIATIILHERAAAMTQQLINQGVIIEENIVEDLTELGQVVEELQEDSVPGFAAAEVAKDEDLQERINNESPLNADEIAANAEKKLAADEAAAAKKAPQADNVSAKDTPQNESLFTTTETVVVTDTRVIEVEKEVVVEKEVEAPTLNTDAPEVKEVNDSLKGAKEGVATVTEADLDLSALNVGTGDILNVVSGTLSNTDESVVDGTVNIFAQAEMTNSDTLIINSADSLHLYGTLTNTGTIIIGDSKPGKLVVEKDGKLINRGTIILADDGNSSFTVEKGGRLENVGKIKFDPYDETFVIKGEYKDKKNEIISQSEDDAVIYLGSFADVAASMDWYSGNTFKLLDAGTLTANDFSYASSNAKITLDMNGNSAALRTVLSDEAIENLPPSMTETGSIAGLFFMGEGIQGASDDTDDSESTSVTNLTLTDSVGGGKLNGGIFLSGGSSAAMDSGTVNGFFDLEAYSRFHLSGGTIVIPEYDEDLYAFLDRSEYAAVSTYRAYFSMTGGTIDASAQETYALNLDLREKFFSPYDQGDEYPASLSGGTLIAQEFAPTGMFYGSSYIVAYPDLDDSSYGELWVGDFNFCFYVFNFNDCGDGFYEPTSPILVCFPHTFDDETDTAVYRADMSLNIVDRQE